MRHRAAKEITGVLLALVLVQAVLLNGVCLLNSPLPASTGKVASLMTIDVCGTGVLHASLSGIEPINGYLPVCYYFKAVSVVPPDPEPAVASADPGEEDKPPEI